jgi:hypothetical protein
MKLALTSRAVKVGLALLILNEVRGLAVVGVVVWTWLHAAH